MTPHEQHRQAVYETLLEAAWLVEESARMAITHAEKIVGTTLRATEVAHITPALETTSWLNLMRECAKGVEANAAVARKAAESMRAIVHSAIRQSIKQKD